MLDGMEKPTLQVICLILVKCCFKGFPLIKYTYVPCLKVAMLFVFVLIIFIVHLVIAYSGPYQTSNLEIFLKIVTFKEGF